MSFETEHALAVLVDIENMARPGARNRGEFDIHLVLNLLAEKGRVVVKRAYADWSRYRDARRELMNAGLELIEMPSAREGAKNRADIKMAVDAMEIAYSRAHVTNFVIVSGDSDFTPLVGKLRELNKRVIGIGRDGDSSSSLLIANCDEFYFYDNIANKATRHHVEGQRPDALSLLRETLEARGREGDEHPQASAVKDSMRRRDPAFSETDIGFSTFSKFLEDAQSKGIVILRTDARSGTYLVELVDGTGSSAPASSSDDESPREIASEGRRRRRRRRGTENGEGNGRETAGATAEAEEAEAGIDDGAEVFVHVLPADREPEVELPPLDQPLSYEALLMDVPDEAPASDEPPSRGARRRRKALSSVPEPDTADLEEVAEETQAPEEAAEVEAEAAPARGRRRRTTAVAAEEESAAVETPAEAAADEAAAPTSRRRVRRGTVLPQATDETAEAATQADADSAEAPPEDKPKRRTRTTKKATDETAEAAPQADADSAEAPAEDKPKRRTRTTKKATDETAEAAPQADADSAEAPAEDKPKRRTRTTTKKATDETAEAAPQADADSAEAPTEDKPKRRTRTTKKATDETADDAGITAGESPY